MRGRWHLPTYFVFLSSFYISNSIQKPSASAWQALNVSVSGRLLTGTPFSRPCFTLADPTLLGQHDANACQHAIDDYHDGDARTSVVGTYQQIEWETCQATGERCLLDPTDPSSPAAFAPPAICARGNIPSYAIDVREVGDVQKGFAFAKQHGVPIVVKNSGHDYLGRSAGAGSLALWTFNLKSMSLDTDFVPQGCPASHAKESAALLGAGVSVSDVLDFADAHNITIPTGSDASVGVAGGYVMGGGHSFVSNALGLAVDRALEFEVITPTGAHVFANECQNSDLFFALRGGGGGTFGILLRVAIRALPQMPINALTAQVDPSPENQRALVRLMLDNGLRFAGAGWGGVAVPQFGLVAYANPVASEVDARSALEPLEEFVNARGGNFTFAVTASWKEYFDTFQPHAGVGITYGLTSRLVPATLFESAQSRAQLYDAIEPTLVNMVTLLSAAPPFYHGNPGGTSVTPEWYQALWLIVTSVSWDYNITVDGLKSVYENLSDTIAPLRAMTPPGTYTNEADLYEPAFSTSFWGTHYDTLLTTKEKYDPDHLLDCWQCVGWLGRDDPRYRCYIPVDVPGQDAERPEVQHWQRDEL